MGRRDGRVPDRGRRRRGRPRPEHLGHASAHTPGRVVERGHRRRGLRPLPPLPRGRRPDGRARARRLPLLGLVAARPARRDRAASTRPGLDFYDRLVDELLARGHRPAPDALPLGPAAGARGGGRLAGPRDRGGLRRLRRRRRGAGSATGCATSPRSTSRTSSPTTATASARTPPGARTRTPRSPRRTTSWSPTASGVAGDPGGRARSVEVGIVLNFHPAHPASRAPARPGGGDGRPRRGRTAGSSTRSPAAATHSDTARLWGWRCERGARRRHGADRVAARLPRRQLLLPPRRALGEAPAAPARAAGGADRDGLGGLPGRAYRGPRVRRLAHRRRCPST